MFKAYFISVVILWAAIGSALDAPSDLERRFTLSSGYIETYFNSNEGLVQFPLSSIQAYSKLFDTVVANFSDHWGVKLATITLELPISFWLAHSLFVPFHEFGHARAMAATGGSYSYGSFGYGTDFSNLTSFWSLSLLRLITPPFGFPGTGIGYTDGNTGVISPALVQFWKKNGYSIIESAAGLNNQMLLAKRIADTIYKRNGHMTYFQHYLGNKIAGFVYATLDQDLNKSNDPLANGRSDPGAVLSGYAAKGYDITHRDLKIQSLVSLVSGTMFSLLRAYYDYFAHNSAVARPAEFFGIRIPDINSYINARGLSYEIESDYRISSALFVGLAYEFIWKGEFAQQFTPRARYNLASFLPVLHELWLNADLVIGNGVGGSLNVDYAPFAIDDGNFWKRFAYFADLNVYNAYTLYGERNIVSLTNGKTVAPEVIFGVHLRY